MMNDERQKGIQKPGVRSQKPEEKQRRSDKRISLFLLASGFWLLTPCLSFIIHHSSIKKGALPF
jgi:hypothetical protein